MKQFKTSLLIGSLMLLITIATLIFAYPQAKLHVEGWIGLRPNMWSYTAEYSDDVTFYGTGTPKGVEFRTIRVGNDMKPVRPSGISVRAGKTSIKLRDKVTKASLSTTGSIHPESQGWKSWHINSHQYALVILFDKHRIVRVFTLSAIGPGGSVENPDVARISLHVAAHTPSINLPITQKSMETVFGRNPKITSLFSPGP